MSPNESSAVLAVTTTRQWIIGLGLVFVVYLHNTLPHLTMMPRVNVDEPWLMERAYQVLRTGIPTQPMLGLDRAYFLQVGFGYLYAPWFGLFGVGLFQARLLGVLLGLGIVMMVASIGRRTIDPAAGLCAALFLALDSNFLGGVRNARTDIPSVFFVTAALAAYLVARQRSRTAWFVVSGASVGLAMLCHGNAFWVAAILLVWYLVDYGRRAPMLPFGYGFLSGLLLTFGPYLVVVWTHWADVQTQIRNFAGDRVPTVRLDVMLHHMGLELERYRFWYFGLVTNLVPNPLLWAFKAATVAGVVALAVRSMSRDRSADPRGPARLLMLVAGSAFIFAAFINNKVPVYMPHLLVGFALAAGFAVSVAARLVRRPALVWLFVIGYGAAGVLYYEKWYSSVGKSELVPYEATDATLHTLVPSEAKYVYASPQFWTSFHAERDTAFYSYAAAQPIDATTPVTLAGANTARPIYLVVDELQWLPELTGPSSSTTAWQQAWIAFIEQRCSLQAEALGTAHGTLALYRCTLAGPAPERPASVRIVGGDSELAVGGAVLGQTAEELAQWTRYDDPRRTSSAQPDVRLSAGGDPTSPGTGVRISGTGWPGIIKMFAAEPASRYLVRATTRGTRAGDLLYLGTWRERQVLSLSGASSSGIPAALIPEPWFPHDRAFIATTPQVQVLIYSEAPSTDFTISSLQLFRLTPKGVALRP